MQVYKTQNKKNDITPRWLGLAQAAVYSSVTAQTLRNWEKLGKLTLHRVSPAGTRGRVLIDREELDSLIVSYAQMPPCQLGMNKRHSANKEGASV